MAYAAFLFVCLCWGSSFILLERVSHAFGPVEIGILRLLSGAAALGVIWWWRRDVYRLERRYWGPILLSALLANVPPYVSQPYVLAQGFGHSFFGIAVAAVPLLTIVMSVPMLGVRPTWRQLLGVVGGLVCLWFVVDDGVDRGMTLGLLALAAIVPVTASFNNTFIKRYMPDVQALPLTAAMLGAAGLMLVPLAFLPSVKATLDLAGPVHPVYTPMTWVYVFLLGVVLTGLSTVAFFYMVLKRGPLFAGMATYVVPILALAWGLLDRETVTGQQILAMGGVLVMVGLVQTGAAPAVPAVELPLDPGTSPATVPPPLAMLGESCCATPMTMSAVTAGVEPPAASV